MLPRIIFPLTAVALLVGSRAGAADITMAHKNATVGINTNGTVASWTVDGVNNLYQQTFFYRVGNNPEGLLSSISSTPTVSITQVPNVISTVDATYSNGSYSVRTLFQLSGGNPGFGTANLNETITVKNLSSSPLDFHFFQYSDFDLGGFAGGQSANVQFDGLLQPYKIVQTGAGRTLTETVNANTAPIGHYEISLFPSLLNSLNDGSPTTLNDSVAAGPGDVDFAYQWDVVLDPNQTLTISKLMSIVPEPATGTLFLAALVVGTWARRKAK